MLGPACAGCMQTPSHVHTAAGSSTQEERGVGLGRDKRNLPHMGTRHSTEHTTRHIIIIIINRQPARFSLWSMARLALAARGWLARKPAGHREGIGRAGQLRHHAARPGRAERAWPAAAGPTQGAAQPGLPQGGGRIVGGGATARLRNSLSLSPSVTGQWCWTRPSWRRGRGDGSDGGAAAPGRRR